jgi:hypothetical protein
VENLLDTTDETRPSTTKLYTLENPLSDNAKGRIAMELVKAYYKGDI